MSKQITGPDGRSYTFPDDASEAEILQFFEAQDAGNTHQRRATASAAQEFSGTAAAGPRRSWWARLRDDASDAWNTSWVAESWRAGELEGAQNAAGQLSLEDTLERDGPLGANPVRAFGRAKGALMQGLFGDDGGVERASEAVAAERERRQDFRALNEGGDSFLRYAREGDPLGLVAHGGAAAAGTLAAAAADPISWIGFGRTVVQRAATQASLAGGMDLAAQDAGRGIGLQEDIDWTRAGLSALAGAGFQATSDFLGSTIARVFHRPEALPEVREALETGDRLNAPALAMREIEPTPPRLDDAVRVVTHPETGKEITLRGPGSPVDQIEGGVKPGDYVENGMVWRETPPALAAPDPNAWREGVADEDLAAEMRRVLETGEFEGGLKANQAGLDWARKELADAEERIASRRPASEGTDEPPPPPSEPSGTPSEDIRALVAREAPKDAPGGSGGRTRGSTSGAAEEPTGFDAADWGARKSPERAAAAIRHLDGLKKWIKPEAVTDFLRLLDGEGIDPAAEGVHINERWVDWEAVDRNPEDILGFTNAIAEVFADVYARAGTAGRGWTASERVMKQMGYTLSDLVKTHADITGEGGLTARSGALRDMALAADKDAFDNVQAVLDGFGRGEMNAKSVTRAAESIQRAILMSAMDAGAASEMARALNFRKRLGKPQFAKNDLQAAVDEISSILNKGESLDEAGLKAAFEELSKSYKTGGSVGMRQTVRKMQELGLWDYLTYYATASLLSAPTTHIKNALAPVHGLFMVGERYIAAGLGAARTGLGLGSKERVTFREALAYSTGMGQAMMEGLSLAGQAFKRGAPILDNRSSIMDDATAGAPVPFQFSRQRLDGWLTKPLSPRTWADAFGVGLFELQRTVGFRVSVAFDEFYKALSGRMETNALAYREAAYRSSLAPADQADKAYNDALVALLTEPTAEAHRAAKEFFQGSPADPEGVHAPGSREEEMALILRSIDHRQMALDHARLMTFQNAGPIVKKIDDAIRAIPIVKAGWVNFIRTPTMVLKAGLIDRTPAASLVALGELTTPKGRQKHGALLKAMAGEEAALARGGAEADLVLARQALGYATLYTLWMYWASGNVTGKQSEEQRKGGVLDYSVRLPDGTWVQYSGIPVIGDMLGLVADTGEGLRHVDIDDDGMMAAVGVVAAALRNNVFNKSFAKGVSDFMEMMNGGRNPNATAETMGKNMGSALTDAFLARAIPAASLQRRTTQTMDPVIRDARSFNEELFSRLPTLSESLAARRDFMGRPLVRTEGQTGIFQAFQTSRPSADPLEAELAFLGQRLGEDFRIGMPSRRMNEAEITPHEYGRLLETQGQLFRIRGKNMEEALRELIATPQYQQSVPEGRALDIKKVIERYREGANRAARNPRSPLYMGETVRRTAAERLREEARAQRLTEGQLFARGRRYGLQPDDPEAQALRQALFPPKP